MAKVVDLTLPTGQFALAETFKSVPDARFEAVPVVAHPPRGMMTYLSATAPHADRMTDALRADDTTVDVDTLSQRNDRRLYQISWQPSVQTVLGMFLQTTGSLLGAWGTADHWQFRCIFPQHESVSRICENWRTNGIDPSIHRVVSVPGQFGFAEMDLSPCQHETLLRAYEMDYYQVPRGATLEGVASELQISHQALSERLRRGHRNLIQTTLCESPTPLPTN